MIGLFFLQRSLIYHPSTNRLELPPPELYQGLEQIALRTKDEMIIEAWYWPAPEPAPTILIFHGNAGDRSGRLGLVRRLHEKGFGVLIPDYRGYGGSQGSPSEEGLRLDANAAVEWLDRNGSRDVIYFGESLGTGVAVDLAIRRSPKALILQSPFDSLIGVAKSQFPFLPVGWLLRDRFESDQKIDRLTCPILFIHGDRDEVVPHELGRALYDRARAPKRWITVRTAGHNDLRAVMGDGFYDEIVRFVRTASTAHAEEE